MTFTPSYIADPASAITSSSAGKRVAVDGRVVGNTSLCREHFRIDIEVDRFPPSEPGQFVQLNCSDGSGTPIVEHDGTGWPVIETADLQGLTVFLRRPFSLAGRRDTDEGVVLSVIYRVVGTATAWLAARSVGDPINVIGPLGKQFPKPADGHAIFVGGGVGIPPLVYLAERWQAASESIALTAFCGATTRELLPFTIIGNLTSDVGRDPTTPAANLAELATHGVKSVVTTDDGSYGFAGLVTTALERYLDRLPLDDSPAQKPTLYTCGPEGMMKRVASIAADRGLECFVAVERAMGCGMGTCQSCVIRVRAGDGWRYALSCTEGPVFDARQLVW